MTNIDRPNRKYLYKLDRKTFVITEYRGIYHAAEILGIEPPTIYYNCNKSRTKLCRKVDGYLLMSDTKLTNMEVLEKLKDYIMKIM